MKAMKILGWIAGLLILTIIAVAIAVPLLMDANDIKQQLVSQVKDRTGRDLRIDGDISLTVFPWAGVELGKTSLSNAAGFADKPFVEVANAGVRVKLLPLLRKEIEMDTVTLKGMTLNLERDNNGRSNWDDLLTLAGDKEKKPEPSEQAEIPEIAALAIGGLDIQDAVVRWNDRQAGKQINITDMNMKTGELRIGEHVDITGGFNLDMKNPDFKGRIDLKSAISANIANNSYRLDDTSLTVDLKDAQGQPVKLGLNGDIEADLIRQFVAITGMKLNGEATYAGKPASVEITSAVDADLKNMTVAMKNMQLNGDAYFNEKPIQLRLNAGIDGNLNKQTLNLKDFNADLNGIKTSGKLAVQQLFTIPAFDGQIVVNEFNPRTDLAALGIALPETSDKNAMTKAAAAVNIAGNLTRFRITKMAAQLDDSRITGSAVIHKLTTNPRYEFDLHLDKLDADRYLPPQQTATATGFEIISTAHAGEAAVIPVAMLQGLNVDGKLAVDSFVIKNIKAQNTSITMKGADGNMSVSPVKTSLYGGSFTGGLDLKADQQHAQSPGLVFNGNLTGIDVGALSNDLTGGATVTGSGNISIGLTTAGLTINALKRNLNGKVVANLKNGVVKGVDTLGSYQETLTKVRMFQQGREKGAYEGKKLSGDTQFETLDGVFNIKNGVITNRDLIIKAERDRTSGKYLLQINGAGNINLLKEKIDYDLKTVIYEPFRLQGLTKSEHKSVYGVPLKTSIDCKFSQLGDMNSCIDKHLASNVKKIYEKSAGQSLEKTLTDKLLGKDSKSKSSSTQQSAPQQQSAPKKKESAEDKLKKKVFESIFK